jgi:hypothetical protein
VLTDVLQPLMPVQSQNLTLSHVDPDPTVGSVQRKFTFRTVSDAGSALENILKLGNTSAAEISPLRWVTKTSFTTALDCYGDNQQHSGAVSAAGGTNPLTAQPLAVATVDTDRVSSTSYGSLVKIAGSAQRKTVARLLGPATCEWYLVLYVSGDWMPVSCDRHHHMAK